MLTDIQNMVHVFANLAVGSTTALCLVIGIAGTFQQRFPYECGHCRVSVDYAKVAPAKLKTVALATAIPR